MLFRVATKRNKVSEFSLITPPHSEHCIAGPVASLGARSATKCFFSLPEDADRSTGRKMIAPLHKRQGRKEREETRWEKAWRKEGKANWKVNSVEGTHPLDKGGCARDRRKSLSSYIGKNIYRSVDRLRSCLHSVIDYLPRPPRSCSSLVTEGHAVSRETSELCCCVYIRVGGDRNRTRNPFRRFSYFIINNT